MAIEIGKTYDNSLDFEVSYLSDKPIHPSHSFWGKKKQTNPNWKVPIMYDLSQA